MSIEGNRLPVLKMRVGHEHQRDLLVAPTQLKVNLTIRGCCRAVSIGRHRPKILLELDMKVVGVSTADFCSSDSDGGNVYDQGVCCWSKLKSRAFAACP